MNAAMQRAMQCASLRLTPSDTPLDQLASDIYQFDDEETIGEWTVKGRTYVKYYRDGSGKRQRRVTVRCECSCGTVREVMADSLRRRGTGSCGCVGSAKIKAKAEVTFAQLADNFS